MSKTLLKPLVGLVAGLLLGSAITYMLVPEETAVSFGTPVERDTEYVPIVSLAEAEVYREDSYSSLTTIEEAIALPTDFAQTEALYVMAGREDTFGIHELLEQAARIDDPGDQRAAISILLTRLTELDPYDALETARRTPLANNLNFEKTVWKTWGRIDLEHALVVAENGTRLEVNNAAQALFAAVRNFDAEQLTLIEEALDVAPDRDTRAQRIYALAADSPAAAIQYIESQDSNGQREQFQFLAYYLSKVNPDLLSGYAELIESDENRIQFERVLAGYGVVANPEAVLANLQQDPGNPLLRSQAAAALQNIARRDPEEAIEYMAQFSDATIRNEFATIVATSMAKTDPQRALAWARDNISGEQKSNVLASVIAQIAKDDPQLAMAEAQSIPSRSGRMMAMQYVVTNLMQKDPASAINMLDLMPESQTRSQLVEQLAQNWGRDDYDSAVQWVTTLNESDKRSALQGMTQRFVRSDVNQAIALSEQFPDLVSRNMKSQIAASLVRQGSIDVALSYIARYEGTDDYSMLQSSIISTTARSDPDQAMRMIGSISDPRHRDSMISRIVSTKAGSDPRAAMQWAETIGDPEYQQQAMGQIVAVWNQSEPQQAQAWMQGLPHGATRDSAILALSPSASNVEESLAMIETMGDPTKRKQATVMMVQRLIRTNPEKAETLLSTLDLTDIERRQFEQLLNGSFRGY